jgi:hypothetical protein
VIAHRGRDTEMANVLIVDDNVKSCRPLVRLLEVVGHHAFFVHDGRAALAMLDRVRPDMILLDVMMPGWTASRSSRPSAAPAAQGPARRRVQRAGRRGDNRPGAEKRRAGLPGQVSGRLRARELVHRSTPGRRSLIAD